MRIEPRIPAADSAAINTANNQRPGAAANTPGGVAGKPSDTVQLSSTQSVLSSLVTQLGNVPDVREQKVDALRAQIQSGQFRIDKPQVANAIVDELLGPNSNG
jgi:flagellar biosynthesis anti-sigma factor FlgM